MRKLMIPLTLSLALLPGAAFAGKVKFKDPKGDDNGPGAYTYPTGAVYKKGSFDLTEVEIKEKGSNIEIELSIATSFEDPWDSKSWPNPGNGFSLQMFQIYVDTDGKKGSGEKDALPGMNAEFDDSSRWEKVIVVSPQHNKRITSEVKQKAKGLADKVVLPKKVTPRGKKLVAVVSKKDLGGSVDKMGWQVLLSSNEGFPKGNDVLSRKVNEYEGEHRFGGGDDGESDPHFVDCLAGKAKGKKDEEKAQHKMLKYDAKGNKRAVLTMIRK
jgi:carbohydrate-binding DOMON domain-containing protein